jgi:hypothetical protein
MTVYVTADGRVVPEGDPEAAYGVQEKDLGRLGLAEPEPAPPPEVLKSANAPEDLEPEAKELPKPSDKALRRPRTK